MYVCINVCIDESMYIYLHINVYINASMYIYDTNISMHIDTRHIYIHN